MHATGDPAAAGYQPLILDPIEWLAGRPRRYRQLMGAWRTSCPRLPVRR